MSEGFRTRTVPRQNLANALRDYYHRLRAAFITEYRAFHLRERGIDPLRSMPTRIAHWDGGTDNDGRVHQPIWPTVVRFAARHDVDPFDLIRAMFFFWHGNKSPQPNYLLSNWALERCREYRTEYGDNLLVRYTSLRSRLTAEIQAYVRVGRYKDVKHALHGLLTQGTTYPPLLAFCAARGADYPELANQFLVDAAFEYLRSPQDYERILGSYLCDDLREFARDEVVRQLLQDSDSDES